MFFTLYGTYFSFQMKFKMTKLCLHTPKTRIQQIRKEDQFDQKEHLFNCFLMKQAVFMKL